MGDFSGSTYTKIGKVQRRIPWPLRKNVVQILELFHIKEQNKTKTKYTKQTNKVIKSPIAIIYKEVTELKSNTQ